MNIFIHRTLRYEDLSLNPYEMTQDVLQFFGLPFDSMVEEFLDTHTKLNIGGVSSTFRDSKTAPFHWKEDLSWEEVSTFYLTYIVSSSSSRCGFDLITFNERNQLNDRGILFLPTFIIIVQCQEKNPVKIIGFNILC